MKNLKESYVNSFFSHIYVEKSVRDHARTAEIMARFPDAHIIEIKHYKDVFCRRGQSYQKQNRAKSLILAAKQGTLLYKGAPVCQSFGNENFYYASCIMNCIFDCEYCYLKGMYPSANLVIFVNLEDYFAQVRKMAANGSLYLCVSYDTDLPGIERIAGYTKEWSRFAAECGNLKIEIRTKCADRQLFRTMAPNPNLIFAFTLSPQKIIESFEHHTPSLKARLACVKEAQERGFSVRLCFDPMIFLKEWKRYYDEMLEELFSSAAMSDILDVSIGSFRISKEYLKNMRKQMPDSAIVWFPYQYDDGYCHYPKELQQEMEQYLLSRLSDVVDSDKIFLWKQ